MSEVDGEMQAVGDTHPGDDELFDLVEGTLARGRRAKIEHHVAGCVHCSARVAAGRVSLARASVLEPMPAADAVRMHGALEQEWDLRHADGVRGGRHRLPEWRRRLNVALAMGGVAVMLGVAVATVDNRRRDHSAGSTADSQVGVSRDESALPTNPAAAESTAGQGNDVIGRVADPGSADMAAPDASTGGASKAVADPDEQVPRTVTAPQPGSTVHGDGSVTVTGVVPAPTCVPWIGSDRWPLPSHTSATTTNIGPSRLLRVVCYT